MELDDFSIEQMADVEIVKLIYGTFGVALDYQTPRKDILKTLRRLSS